MFFNFPEDARWNAERQAAEFGVEIGEYRGVVRVLRRVVSTALAGAAHARAVYRGVLPTADPVREHSAAKWGRA